MHAISISSIVVIDRPPDSKIPILKVFLKRKEEVEHERSCQELDQRWACLFGLNTRTTYCWPAGKRSAESLCSAWLDRAEARIPGLRVTLKARTDLTSRLDLELCGF
jgi:hypothetical protein